MSLGAGAAWDRAGRLRGRLMSSILVKVLAALLVAVVSAGVITGVVSARLTRSALEDQARELASSRLSTLEAAFREREANVVAALRNLAQLLSARGLIAAAGSSELIAELGRAARTLGLDAIEVLSPDGRRRSPPARVGEVAVRQPVMVPAGGSQPASRLLPTTAGGYVQAVTIPVGGPAGITLMGGVEFSDAYAYRLRRQLGRGDHVVLVAGGRVAGSTLPRPPGSPPGSRGGELPAVPDVVSVEGRRSLVAYHPVARLGAGTPGALGVLLPDPVSSLDRALTERRRVTTALLTLVTLALGWLLFRMLTRRVVRLARTSRRIAAGDLDAPFDVGGADEIGALAGALEAMRVELRAKLDLVARQAASLQESSRRIVSAQDGERHRLARDLHDGIQQQLVVLRMGLGLAREHPPADAAAASRLLAEVGADVDRAIESLREVSQDLYPSILVDRGLASALRSLLGRLPVAATLDSEPEPFPRLAADVESAAYFLSSEALTNAIKHADPTQIAVNLRLEGGWLALGVADDGCGFDPAATPRCRGLLHMEDRVRSFGGDLQLVSTSGSGTTVVAMFPVAPGGATDQPPGEAVPAATGPDPAA